MRATLAAAVGALVTVVGMLAPAAPAVAKGPPLDVQFLGQAIVPTGTMFEGTTVGGLSSITYDGQREVFYAVSDDPSQLQPARFYTVALDLSDGGLTDGDVVFTDVTTLLSPDDQSYAPFSLDPEGLALTKDGELILTSEGFANSLIDPFVRRYALDGSFLGSLPVPQPFLPTADRSSGVRQNLAFESAGVPPNGRFVFTATENALFQDGPVATLAGGSPARILRYNLQTGRLDRQWVYWTDPVAEPPVPASQFSVNGLVELLPLNNEFLIAMERSFSVGAPGTGNSIKLYAVALAGATDVNGVAGLQGGFDRVRPVRKTLLLDLDELGIPLDNVEGLTFGPRLPDGRRSLVLVSDNNFAPSQFTQFLLFALDR
jgi:3-phytase/alkaline phosphatase D